MRKHRLASILLCCVLLVGIISGCASKSNPKTSESSLTTVKTDPATGPTKLPLVKPGSATLTVATMDNWIATKSFSENLPVYQELEKLTGVKIKWECTPVNDYSTVMQTRLAAGTNLPDIFVVPWGSSADKLGTDGISIPLNDLIPKKAFYLDELMKMNPLVKKGITGSDGKIYAYPGFGEGIISGAKDMETGVWEDPSANINIFGPVIRKDWLEKLNLKVPTTLDEWYTVLKAFKTQDPNGNKKADEIALTPTFGISDLYMFGDAFGLYMAGNAGSEWAADSKGKVAYKFTDPRFKELLTFLNKLYAEGLIDPEYASAEFSKTSEKINRNMVGALSGDWMSNFASYNKTLIKGGVTTANWAPIKSVKNPDGKAVTFKRWSIWKTTAISKDCKNPELALQWLDIHALSPKGINLQMFGVEGKSYNMKDGKAVLTDWSLKNPDGIGVFEALRTLGAWGQISYIQTKDAYNALWADQPDIIKFSESFTKEDVLEPFPDLSFSTEELQSNSEIATNIRTYRDEMVMKFIEGKEPLSKFDEYISKIKSFGLDQVAKNYQTAYDRFQNTK